MKANKANYPLFSLTVGFLIWLSATVLFRLAGQYFFLVDNAIVLAILYLILIPSLGFISTCLFNKFNLGQLESIKAAALMVLPGMLLDTLFIQFFEIAFPNMPEIYSKTFGSWLMFAYSIVLISGLLRKNEAAKA